MSHPRPPRASLAQILGGVFLVLTAALPAAAAERTAPAERELALTVYRQGTALVQDRRQLSLSEAPSTLIWPGVAPALQHDTVRLAGQRPLAGYRLRDPGLSLDALLEAYEGRPVVLAQRGGREEVDAMLVSAQPPLVAIDGAVRSVDPRALIFPEGVPAELGGPPALELELGAASGAHANLTVGYLASGLSWAADYVATVSADGQRLDLVARATIANDTGMDIEAAATELVAGELKVPHSPGGPERMHMASAMADRAASGAEPEPLGDLQRYMLDEPVTVGAGERYSRQLFSRGGIALERQYVLRSGVQLSDSGAPGWQRVPLVTELGWTNEGGPLPAGTVRVYRRDESGRLRFVGGDRIEDRPVDQRVTIEPGQPFDISARRRQTEYERIERRSHAVAHAIELHNASDDPATIRIEERLPGDWQITDANQAWEKAAAHLAVWRVELAPGQRREIRYRARIEQ